jgi:hypothetical protein
MLTADSRLEGEPVRDRINNSPRRVERIPGARAPVGAWEKGDISIGSWLNIHAANASHFHSERKIRSDDDDDDSAIHSSLMRAFYS